MELREIYGMYLNVEDLDAMFATEQQKKLIDVFESYNDTELLIRDIRHLDVTRTRHKAGVEFCGCAPFRKIQPTKIKALIEAVKGGQPVTKAANDIGMTREWARAILLKNGFVYDKVDKKWNQIEGFSIKSFSITGDVHTNKQILPRFPTDHNDTPKFEQLIKFLKYGASLKKASALAGVSYAHAWDNLKAMGYVHKNIKWHRKVE